MATDFQTGYAGLYQGKTISELLTRVLNKLGQTGYTRYSQAYIMDLLDDKQREFAARTRVLKGWSLIPMRASVPSYALPKMCLPDGLERARFFESATNYDDLEIRDRDYMDTHYSGWMGTADGTPMIVVVGDWFGNVMKIDIYPPPANAGTTLTTNSDLGVIVGGTDLPTDWNDITGEATGGSTTTLQDTEVDFTTMGLAVGMAVVKTGGIAGSEPVGQISVIAAHQLTFDDVMTNSGSFSSGDSYQIMAGEVGTITDVSNEDSYVFTADVGVIGQLTVPDNNVMIEFRRYPVSIDDVLMINYQKPEIPWAWHNVLADAAAGDILEADTQRRSQLDLAFSQKLQRNFELAIMDCLTKPTMPAKRAGNIKLRLSR
jgi:hypothetical protein